MGMKRALLLFFFCPIVIYSSQFEIATSDRDFESINWFHDEKSSELLVQCKDAIHSFITWISNPFPHSDLLTTQALFGNLSDILSSFQKNTNKWIDWQRGWIIVFVVTIATSVLLPLLYVLYRFSSCFLSACCSRTRMRSKRKNRSVVTLAFIIFLLIDLCSAIACVVLVQYSHYGYTTLRPKVRQSLDDLLLYRNQNEKQLQVILLDDFQRMNASIVSRLTNSSHNVVDSLKTFTGLQAIDDLRQVGDESKILLHDIHKIFADIEDMNDLHQKSQIDFTRLKKTILVEVRECAEKEIGLAKTACLQIFDRLDGWQIDPLSINKTKIISNDKVEYVQTVIDIGLDSLGNTSMTHLTTLELFLRAEIEKKILNPKFHDAMQKIGDDLFVMFESISSQVRKFNLESSYKTIDILLKDDPNHLIKSNIKRGWIVLSVFCALLATSSVLFLFGTILNVCSSQTFDDRSCSQVASAKFFRYGTGCKMLLIILTGWIAPILLLTAGNISNIVCDPLKQPENRPDFVTLVERYVGELHSQGRVNNDLYDLLKSRPTTEIIKACQDDKTFFVIFGLDKKLQLDRIKELENESYDTLTKVLSQSLSELPELTLPPIHLFISNDLIEKLDETSSIKLEGENNGIIMKLKREYENLDFNGKIATLRDDIERLSLGSSKQLESTIALLEDFDRRLATPLRKKVDGVILSNLSIHNSLNKIANNIDASLKNVKRAEKILFPDVKTEISRKTKSELSNLIQIVDEYISKLENEIKTKLAPCSSVTEILKLPAHGFCTNTIDPLIGLSLAIFLTAVCSVPLVQMARKLTISTRRLHYSKPPVDDSYEFSTDTYAPALKPIIADEGYRSTRLQI